MSLLSVLVFACLFVVVFELYYAIYLLWPVLVNLLAFPFFLLSIVLLMFSGFDRESGVYAEIIIVPLCPELLAIRFLLNLYT